MKEEKNIFKSQNYYTINNDPINNIDEKIHL